MITSWSNPPRPIDESGKPAVITNHGKPHYLITAMSEEEWEDYVLANAPEFVESMREADENFRAGRTIPMEQILQELDIDPAEIDGQKSGD